MRHLVVILVGLWLVPLVACGGGGGEGAAGTPSGVDLGGWWFVESPLGGPGSLLEPWDLVSTLHSGSSVWLEGAEGTILSGNIKWALPDGTDPNRRVLSVTIVDEDRLEGSADVFSGGSVGLVLDIVMTRTGPPSGLLTADGTVHGNTLAVDTHTGYAAVTTGHGLWSGTLVHSTPMDWTEVVFGIDGIAFVEPQPGVSYAIGVGPLVVSIGVRTAWADASASAGSILFTEVEPGRLAGAFSAELTSGETVGGLFDVPVLITR